MLKKVAWNRIPPFYEIDFPKFRNFPKKLVKYNITIFCVFSAPTNFAEGFLEL